MTTTPVINTCMTTPDFTAPLSWTGERMVPESAPPHTFWEHIYRYRFARRFARHRRVLDIACGEGYGTAAMLRGGASQAIGVDICPDSCRHAAARYHVDARQGSAADIPVDSRSIDVVVSFETIEHLESPAELLVECVRVLAPGGLAVISSPDRDVYRAGAAPNEFHHSEMNRHEFRTLLDRHFRHVEMYSQCVLTAPAFSRNALAAFQSPWLALRGFWRFRRWALRDLCDVDIYEPRVSAQFREAPVAAILADDGPCARLLNPFAVRRSSNSAHERAVYQVAVCREPKTAGP